MRRRMMICTLEHRTGMYVKGMSISVRSHSTTQNLEAQCVGKSPSSNSDV